MYFCSACGKFASHNAHTIIYYTDRHTHTLLMHAPSTPSNPQPLQTHSERIRHRNTQPNAHRPPLKPSGICCMRSYSAGSWRNCRLRILSAFFLVCCVACAQVTCACIYIYILLRHSHTHISVCMRTTLSANHAAYASVDATTQHRTTRVADTLLSGGIL